jgi:hypothetical protein
MHIFTHLKQPWQKVQISTDQTIRLPMYKWNFLFQIKIKWRKTIKFHPKKVFKKRWNIEPKNVKNDSIYFRFDIGVLEIWEAEDVFCSRKSRRKNQIHFWTWSLLAVTAGNVQLFCLFLFWLKQVVSLIIIII